LLIGDCPLLVGFASAAADKCGVQNFKDVINTPPPTQIPSPPRRRGPGQASDSLGFDRGKGHGCPRDQRAWRHRMPACRIPDRNPTAGLDGPPPSRGWRRGGGISRHFEYHSPLTNSPFHDIPRRKLIHGHHPYAILPLDRCERGAVNRWRPL